MFCANLLLSIKEFNVIALLNLEKLKNLIGEKCVMFLWSTCFQESNLFVLSVKFENLPFSYKG